MQINVKYFAMIRDLAGKKTETLTLPENVDVNHLIRFLIRKYGEKIAYYILDENGNPRDYLSYMLNGINIYSLNGLQTKINDGDTFTLLPPIGGGRKPGQHARN
jgi:molybdopterin synthase sulfur carrier subunit